MKHRFYGLRTDKPLSAVHGTEEWESSVIGRLNQLSKGQIFIREIPRASLGAEYGWRVVDARLSQEDGLMSRFTAYDLEGDLLPQAVFGIHWDEMNHRIGGGFSYRPEFGNSYYIPAAGFLTSQTGGYTVQVLDLDWPSEGLAFGHLQSGNAHHAVIVAFRLFKLNYQGKGKN